MPEALPENEVRSVPQLLVELPSGTRVFFGNLRDLIFPRRLSPLELRSAPALFWHDVFVKRPLPWSGFFQSVGCHFVAFALLVGISRFFALQPRAVNEAKFERSQVVYYSPSEYLPPIDTRSESAATPRKADPELSRQPIISLPREVDNRSQTIVTPANFQLKRDVAMPNTIAWAEKTVRPQLEIPPVPLSPAAEITRIAPDMNAVVAPPSDIHAVRSVMANAPEPSLIAPPPSVETARTRSLGDVNIGHSEVINPSPQLAVSEQRAIPGGRASALTGMSPQVVAPPSSLSASASAGSAGRLIALNLHPAIGAPTDPPQGNRRGAFAAAPEGNAGASGSPGNTSGASSAAGSSSAGAKGSGNGTGKNSSGTIPSGLYVGKASANTSPMAGDPGPSSGTSGNQVNPNLIAGLHRPRRMHAQAQPGNTASLTEPERAIFSGRKFYSVTLNAPNLNSAGGSWIVRFAENKNSPQANNAGPAAELSEPVPVREVDPGYPIQLMRQNIGGTVILYAVIRADGTVHDVRLLQGVDNRIDNFAEQALEQWRFQPAMKNGTPVDVDATFQIPFRPARVGSNF